MSERSEIVTKALEEILYTVCNALGRELPPPARYHATELRSEDGLSVYEVQAGGGVEPEEVGQWAINAGPSEREKESRFATREDAIDEVETLARLESESKA